MKQSIKRAPMTLAVLGLGAAFGASAVTCANTSSSAEQSTAGAGITQLMAKPAYAQLAAGPSTVADIAEAVVPSVVNISATRVMRTQMHPMMQDPMFREFFGPDAPMQRERKQQSLGSGVIVGSDGVIITNNHVVEGAEGVRVNLHDGRTLDGKVVGSDPKSDLAVIRLEGNVKNLQPLPIGRSGDMRLGDAVLAIGNPFGVGQTVTMGIVSATGRGMGIVDYEDFIQTDAAINPGNSGGALVNLKGQLIGINTAIISRTGGSNGIGFAIPTDMAKPIVDSLLKDGKVERGWLGVAIQTLDGNLAKGLGLKADRGVLVSDVTKSSPADKAGFERGDVIVAVDGKRTDDASDLRNLIASAGPDRQVAIEVVRDGKTKQLRVKLGRLAAAKQADGATSVDEGVLSGVVVSDLHDRARRQFGIPGRVDSGVVVTRIDPNSTAAEAGLRPGDVILEINKKRVSDSTAFARASESIGDTAILLVYRDGVTVYLPLRG